MAMGNHIFNEMSDESGFASKPKLI